MNRRALLKQLALLPFGLLLPRIQAPLYTYGAWLLPLPADCDPVCNPVCLEFTVQTGTQVQRDAFFAGLQGFRGRGWYGFSHPGILSQSEIAALRGLFEKCDTLFPIIQKESQ